MTYRCRICGSEGTWAEYTVREMMLGTGDPFHYFQCGRCDCLQIAAIPENIQDYYPADYYSYSPESRERTANSISQWLRNVRTRSTIGRDLFSRMIRTMFPHRKLLSLLGLDITGDSAILDIGCGSGWRLYALREAGFINTLGIDPFIPKDIVYGNGLRVLKRSVREIEGAWDVIMYHHSFEHVPDQLDALLTTAKHLKPGGTCLIRIPVVSSYAWQHYREHWYQIDAPRHYYLHSLKSMDLLARTAGMAVGSVVFDSTEDQFRGSELIRKGVPLVRGGAFTRRQVRAWKMRARMLNRECQGDQAAFYLRGTGGKVNA